MFIVCKKRVLIVIAVILVAIIVIVALAGAGVFETAGTRLVPIYNVQTDSNNVALTFDASWGSDKTRGIMDILEENGYKGTFFLTGIWIDANPDLVKEIHERGHQIGNHSVNHKHMSSLSTSEITTEITEINDKINTLTGVTPTCFRAPFGEYDNNLINKLTELNMQCIQWNIDTLDWKGISGAQITERVVKKLSSGSIILFHNNSDHVLDALPTVILAIKNKGLNAVRVDELVYKDGYTIDAQGKQIKNN